MNSSVKLAVIVLLISSCVVPCALAAGEEQVEVPVDSDRWILINAERTERLGRPCIIGRAVLKELEFTDGIIEVDVALTGARSYPGFLFRIQSPGDYERVYIRPHRPNLYGDVVQYTPSINGISGWQLFNGRGYTSGADLATDEWLSLRLEVKGGQAQLFIGDAEAPALVVDHLEHGASKGTIGIDGPRDGSACFSDLRYTLTGALPFDPPPPVDTRPGMIREWQLSRALPSTAIDVELHPDEQELTDLEWREVTPGPSGLVDVARHTGRTGRAPDAVYAKTTIRSATKQVREYKFGYSDAIAIFFNGRMIFSGNSAYRQRDPSFLGIVGLFDSVYLPLEEGDNELMVLVVESFGGWGFMFQEAQAIFTRDGVSKAWETPDSLLVPESVVYDPVREVFYVSNFDALMLSPAQEGQPVSRISADGEILDPKWVTGLARPTGMLVDGDRLIVVERGALVEIDIEKAEITQRHAIPGAVFPNDVALDDAGAIYVSDSAGDAIHRFRDGQFELWLGASVVNDPNGMLVDRGKLIWGNNGDGSLKSADLESKQVSLLAPLGDGIIDGVRSDGRGNYLVSHWQGRLFRVSPSGEVEKLLDTTAPATLLADFEYAAQRELLVIPTFYGNSVIAYSLND
jgi:sugar lactone lactonase YvrE